MKFQIEEQSQPSYARPLLQSHLSLEDQPWQPTKWTRIRSKQSKLHRNLMSNSLLMSVSDLSLNLEDEPDKDP